MNKSLKLYLLGIAILLFSIVFSGINNELALIGYYSSLIGLFICIIAFFIKTEKN